MPNARLSDATAALLKQVAIPLEDSYDSVIRRLAEHALKGIPYPHPSLSLVSPEANIGEKDAEGDHSFDAMPSVERHPQLTYSHVRDAVFGGTRISKPTWNSLAKYAHETAATNLGTFDALRLATKANMREGKYEQEGFSYLEDAGISLQGMDSNMAWENSLRLAKKLQVPIKVVVEWSKTHKAGDNAGKTQVLSWTP